jgi:hypothetical protein
MLHVLCCPFHPKHQVISTTLKMVTQSDSERLKNLYTLMPLSARDFIEICRHETPLSARGFVEICRHESFKTKTGQLVAHGDYDSIANCQTKISAICGEHLAFFVVFEIFI